MKIILDTDIDGDIADVGALAMLHAMSDNGEIEILALMVSSLHEWFAPAVDVINTFYNRLNIPIVVPMGAGQNKGSRYAKQLAHPTDGCAGSISKGIASSGSKGVDMPPC